MGLEIEVMRIDGKALRYTEVKLINSVINKYWNDVNTEEVDLETFIQSSYGPDAIEVLVGGVEWTICDRLETNAIILRSGGKVWIACQELFNLAAKYSPLERIVWHLQKNK